MDSRKILLLIGCIQLLSLQVECGQVATIGSSTENKTLDPYEAGAEETTTAGSEATQEVDSRQPLKYLKKFGYLAEGQAGKGNALGEDAFEQAILAFQKFVGIPETGKMDALTEDYMKRPRCGNQDFEKLEYIDGRREEATNSSGLSRVKRFALYGSRWQRQKLTYRIRNYPNNLRDRPREVNKIFERAFSSWSKVTQLDFERRALGKADIDIWFVERQHNCERGEIVPGVLAHAFFPKLNTDRTVDIHFYTHHPWTVDSTKGRSLLANALHEIGHSLGMGHSSKAESKMWSIENGLESLQHDDIVGVQVLYNSRDHSTMDKFHLLAERSVERKLDQYNKTVKTLDECAKYAADNKINLIVWDKKLRLCTIKRTVQGEQAKRYSPSSSMYTELGDYLGQYDVELQAQDTTEAQEDVAGWVRDKVCDVIVRQVTHRSRTYYKCKVLREDKCCTVLLRKDPTGANLAKLTA